MCSIQRWWRHRLKASCLWVPNTDVILVIVTIAEKTSVPISDNFLTLIYRLPITFVRDSDMEGKGNANASNKCKQNSSDDNLDRITECQNRLSIGIAQSDFTNIQNLNMVFGNEDVCVRAYSSILSIHACGVQCIQWNMSRLRKFERILISNRWISLYYWGFSKFDALWTTN